MTPLELVSTSRAQDAAYLALNDLAVLASRIGGDYRIIGGHMVTLLVAASGATGVPDRETADADFGAPFSVIRDRRLLDELYNRGYRQTGAANRFERNTGDLPLTIDVLAPSYSGRHEPNQAHGELVVDEIPGLGYALALPARQITAGVRLTDGAELTTTILTPHLTAALCIKALAYRSRLADKDALDLWRLLEAAYAERLTASDWPTRPTPTAAAEVLHRHFARPNGAGVRGLTRTQQARVQALVVRIVGRA